MILLELEFKNKNSPGMSVRLCCWRQNEGVSGRGPGSSHVHPAEVMSEVKR